MINVARTALYCASAVALTLAVSSTAFAQGMTTDKMSAVAPAGQAMTKTLAENDKVQVIDNVVPPGTMSPITSRLGLIAYYVRGGTSERGYADGTKEVVERKTGETFIVTEKRPYSLKNVGTTTIHVITVRLK